MLGLLDPRQDDPRSALLRAEVLDRGGQRALDDVVPEHDDGTAAAGEPLGEAERLGDPTRLVLVPVEEAVDPVLVAVAQQTEELARMGPSGDEHELLDAGVHQRLDRPADHRPVVDREEVLVRDLGERVQARARAAGQDHALECRRHRGRSYEVGASRGEADGASIVVRRVQRSSCDGSSPLLDAKLAPANLTLRPALVDLRKHH